MTTLNLDQIVDISVEVSPLAAPRATFNVALFIGTKTGIIDTTERLRLFTSADEVLEAGYLVTDPEYIAASIYFSQSPSPRRLYIGYQDLTVSPEETPVEALTACRAKNYDWYYAVCLAGVKADHVACAAYLESASPSSVYAYTTTDADCLLGATSPDNIFEALKALSYARTIGQYATTQTAAYPNNIYAICAILGYACGQNSGLAGSAFTLKFKPEVGIAVEPLTQAQVTNIEGQNGNVYVSYGNYYNFFEQGKMANGDFLDERVNIDMLVNNIQLSVLDLLNATPKIPQTDSGVNEIINAINQACEQAVSVGFLASGTWTGIDVLNLKYGDTLPKGYLVQAQALSEQSTADRELRKSVPLYVAIKEAGAVHSLVIGVLINR